MLKIHIGLIGAINHSVLKNLPLAEDCCIRIFSNFDGEYNGNKFIKVGENSSDIDLCGAKTEEITEYIVDMCDIVISENFNYVCDRARTKKGSLYICDDKARLGLRTMTLDDKKVSAYCAKLVKWDDEKEDLVNPFWKNAYGKFFKKFKRKSNAAVYNENIDKNSEMYNLFERYDSKANKYNSIYRSSLYLRALFPLLATLTLAFAQNTKTFGEFIFGGKYWGIAAAALFIVQALFNYIIIALSNYIVRHFIIENFIHNRYMAESLRMIILLAPNSLPRIKTDRIVFTDTENRLSALDNHANMLFKDNLNLNNSFSSKTCGALQEQLKAMAHNQLGYHNGNALNCQRAENHINTCAKIFFASGLIAVLGRSIYQLIMQFVNMGATVNGVTIGAFFLSLMNFFALLIPSFTTMFMDLKKGLNISNNRARSQVMTSLLGEYIEALDSIKNPEYSDVYPAASALSDILIQEALDWNTTTEQHKISKM